ncbi:hypothetical protein APHAL10511_006036 [Amanita phalloides]|nr:hypothetical protein APHAL10511_006036 [Amanita phalloides]
MHSPPPSRQSRIHFLAGHAPARPTRRSSMPPSANSDPALAPFSDEYDLSQDDPRILQDVHRALKLKAKREATLKRHSVNRPTAEVYFPPSLSVASSSMYHRKATGTLLPATANLDADVDFGPSVGSSNTVADGHPVPSSSDNGLTLDWSGVRSDGDKRWSLSIKRKGKDTSPHLNILVQQQDKVHLERLEKIQRQASRATLQKASITSDQLTRRYALLNSSYPPPKITDVARWYNSQLPVAKAVIVESEPPTWLKHLQQRRRSTVPSPWQLTAQILEEYVHAHNEHDELYPIREGTPTDVLSGRSFSPSGTPFIPVTSRGSSLDPGRSFEGPLSFEPLTRSTRNSLDVISRRSVESGYSSPGSKSSNAPEIGRLNGKRRPDDLSSRLQRRLTRESEGVHLTRNSLSDVSEQCIVDDPFKMDENRVSSPEPRIQVIVTAESDSQVMLQGLDKNDVPDDSVNRPNETARLAPWTKTKRVKPVDQEKMRREYDAKAHLLEEATAQNHRIRQLLNRVSIVVKDYEVAQSNALASLSSHHQLQRLPRELLEAFSHDPAAVTGPTRRLYGWRAVDDIYNRLVKQRAICRHFLSEHVDPKGSKIGSILREPANALKDSLVFLEQYTTNIQLKATEVGELLRKVQDVHTEVKANYNDALSHTSAVYPELSSIVRLEESYKDQYQQFWEIGMDALTLILDSVTPFWRIYGKTIWEDIQDFLIIPVYRNEFTGEAKHYPITHVPKRSLQHWLGLCLFCIISFTATLVQTRIVIASHNGLRYIPYEGIRWTAFPFLWIAIVIQWLIIFIEYAILILEVATMLWWTGWSIKVFN